MAADSLPDSVLDPEAPCLFETNHGTVVHCTCCGRFQVTFNGIVLLLGVKDFERLLHTAAAAAERVRNHPPRWWCLSVPTDAGEVCALVKSDELLELCDLLKGAAAMRELDAILNEVNAS